jgi:hypothetical protein
MTSPSQLRERAVRLFAVALIAKDASLADELAARAIGYLDDAIGTADPAELPPPDQTERVSS